MPYVVWHAQDEAGKPLADTLVSGVSPTLGTWAAETNACGDAFTLLAPGQYDVTFHHTGYTDAGYYPATIGSEGGRIAKGLVHIGPVFTAAPRIWRGQMCGIRVAGLPPIDGGAPNPDLFLSWFYDRYDAPARATIRAQMKAQGYTHWLLSWPDSRTFGQSPAQFRDTCAELIADGFFPCVMLSSKDHDPKDVPEILARWADILPLLIGLVPMFCVGWELSLWLSPTQVQQLIDALTVQIDASPVGAQTLRYVHFQQHYFSFQQPGGTAADFWKLQVGKLTGLLAQKVIPQDDAGYLDWIHDCLVRCAGQFNMPGDSGFGHPFDFVMFEISAMTQFDGSCSEAEGDRLGRLAINAPAETGPGGTVRVMGSGNGG